MRRCPHGVWKPDRLEKDDLNDCCSVCCPSLVRLKDCKYLIVRENRGLLESRFYDLKAE